MPGADERSSHREVLVSGSTKVMYDVGPTLASRRGCLVLTALSLLFLVVAIGVVALMASGGATTPPSWSTIEPLAVGAAGLLTGSVFVVVVYSVATNLQRAKSPQPVALPAPADGAASLSALAGFIERMSARLRSTYRMHRALAWIVMVILLAVLAWSVAMVTMRQLTYAVALGSTSVGGLVLTGWKWQPFDRATRALVVATSFDALVIGMQMRLDSINKQPEPPPRSDSLWRAALEFSHEIKTLGEHYERK